jgi:prepilin-type N-terminal cleavage/methylation domain-containing protein
MRYRKEMQMRKRNCGKRDDMRSDHGYTLMETLVVIAIMLLMGGVCFNFINTSMGANKKAFKNYSVAIRFLSIDSYVREKCAAVHIPYWDTADVYIPSVTATIASSKYKGDIRSIEPIKDAKSNVRGLRVTYSVNGIEATTDAVFSSIPVMESP